MQVNSDSEGGSWILALTISTAFWTAFQCLERVIGFFIFASTPLEVSVGPGIVAEKNALVIPAFRSSLYDSNAILASEFVRDTARTRWVILPVAVYKKAILISPWLKGKDRFPYSVLVPFHRMSTGIPVIKVPC